MLEVSDLSSGYDGEAVVRNVSLTVAKGEVVAIIGSNGAGKTTLLRAVCGLIPVLGGDVAYEGRSIRSLATHEIARSAIAFVPSERHLFPEMSVMENLTLGAYPARPDQRQIDLVFELYPTIAERRRQATGTLSGGEQQMVALGRALMSRPRLLILDEPTTGLAQSLAERTYESFATLRSRGVTILLAEQQVPLALGLADRAYVMENGVIQLEGSASELIDNPTVKRAYLGIA